MSVSIEYSTKEINEIVFQNVLKMLVRRNVLDDYEEIYKKHLDDFVSKSVVSFVLKDKTYSINLYGGKISSISQNSQLDEYLKNNNNNVHKILILKELSKKVANQIMEYSNAEFFFEHEMMEDIPSKNFIPEHILLTPDDKKVLLETFKEIELAKITDKDMMSRYFRAVPGDIFKIIRPSNSAGKNIFYRRVVCGSLNQIFNS
jgi:DNA-directed RNA polymerase subunit H (RpoH/RPB5)